MNGLNLLPWREQLREERKRQFLVSLGGSVVIGLLIIVLVHTVIGRQLESQHSINEFLQKEITAFNKQIEQIKELKAKKEDMLQRLALIHELQASRPLTVKFYDELVRITPPGIYIHSIKREGDLVAISGKGQSNTRISQFMRNIESSAWVKDPVLSEIKTDVKDQNYSRDFTLRLQLKGADGNSTKIKATASKKSTKAN